MSHGNKPLTGQGINGKEAMSSSYKRGLECETGSRAATSRKRSS